MITLDHLQRMKLQKCWKNSALTLSFIEHTERTYRLPTTIFSASQTICPPESAKNSALTLSFIEHTERTYRLPTPIFFSLSNYMSTRKCIGMRHPSKMIFVNFSTHAANTFSLMA
ncbi:hypothetical protein M513_06673 [Trichuris suis]|uniref:Uncharacterized protein n=1 Tax=Trichuris suis TaxID=68888 RepID=A0A085M5I0_9BILA|nr:hypothetical protein M513_06673 [Trichuris suis]